MIDQLIADPRFQRWAEHIVANRCESCGTPLARFLEDKDDAAPFCFWCVGGLLLADKCRHITQGGTLCSKKASESITGMCHLHDAKIRDLIRDQSKMLEAAARDRRGRQEKERRQSSTVYYLQRANGDIKIGYSSQLNTRMRTLSREHGYLVLMATHSGGPDAEAAMHAKFAEERIDPRREWFRSSNRLMNHIEAINRRRAVTAQRPQTSL